MKNSNYKFSADLEALWLTAVKRYRDGKDTAGDFLSAAEQALLASHGLGVMDLFDPVEDYVRSGEPDFGTFLLVSALRREYFLTVQGGVLSPRRISMDALPAKTDSVRGIEWLPRILPKARAKLRGEMPPELMYGCGGDRRFFRRHGIHPAEFLWRVWQAGEADEPVVEWVAAQPVFES